MDMVDLPSGNDQEFAIENGYLSEFSLVHMVIYGDVP